MRNESHSSVVSPCSGSGLTLTDLLRQTHLDRAQRRTVVLAVALAVAAAHADRRVAGPVHPRDVLVPLTGRPRLVAVRAPDGWSQADDVVSLRRMTRALLGEDVRATSAADLARRLAQDGRAAALPSIGSAVRPPTRCGPRRRWWGRAS